MDDERCDCLFSRAKPQFLGAVNVDSGMHSHAGAWERGIGFHHSRKGLPHHSRKTPRHSREGGNP